MSACTNSSSYAGCWRAEPDLTINSGFGNAHCAAEHGSVDTRFGKLRAQNGHPEPFHIRIWTIGNEMYGDWQFGHMRLDQYWVKHNYIVEAMKKVDPTIKAVLSGASVCERRIGVAERISDIFPNPWEAPVTDKPPFEFGSHEDWDGWLLANCADNVASIPTPIRAWRTTRRSSPS
jgi:alpha-L-arabinofuranosidase